MAQPAHWAVSWPPPRSCHACARPCRCAHKGAGTPCPALCRAQGRFVSQLFRTYQAPPAPYRGACSAVSQCCCAPCRSLSRDTPSSHTALCHDTPICIATHPQWLGHARTRAARLGCRAAVSQGLLTVSQRLAARQPGRVAPSVGAQACLPSPVS